MSGPIFDCLRTIDETQAAYDPAGEHTVPHKPQTAYLKGATGRRMDELVLRGYLNF